MTLTLTTKYENIHQEWIDWWIKHNGPNYGIKRDNFEKGEDWSHMIESKDPTSPATARTLIVLEQE